MAKRRAGSKVDSEAGTTVGASGALTTEQFNLLTEPWIPVLRLNGRFERVGIRAALLEAGLFRQIAASNPMDNVALLRFLLAVLMWCRPEISEDDRMQLNGAACVPEEWLSKLNEHGAVFNLLGEGKRFYQDESIKGNEPRPIADLLVEFPGADSINHMRHVVHDGSYGFCPACCAMGILRLSVWAPANKFYPASVNPASAAYSIAQENSLLQTLFSNLPSAAAKAEQAPWLSSEPPASPGPVAYLAWRPRRMWLNVGPEQGSCAYCGRPGVLIVSLCNGGGWPTPETAGRTKKFWDADPLLLKDGEPISLPGLETSAEVHASRFWRNATRLRGAREGRVVTIGPAVHKFTFHDATSVSPPKAAAHGRATQSDDCRYDLRKALKQITSNPARQHPEINAALVLMTPDAEARIRAMLHGSAETTDDAAFLHEVYQPVVRQVVTSTAGGSPLRRREAMARAQSALNDVIRKAMSSPKSAAPGDKPKQMRKKKGESG